MRKLHIAVVTRRYPPKGGGVSTVHYNLIKGFRKLGHEAVAFSFLDSTGDIPHEAVTRGIGMAARKILSGINLLLFTALDFGKRPREFLEVLYSAAGAFRIGRKIREFQPDLIIVPDHGAPSFFIPKPSYSKMIWISHHNPMRFLDNPLFGQFSEKDARFALWFEKRALRKADYVVCPSEYMKQKFTDTYHIKKPLQVIANPIDSETIETIMPQMPKEFENLPRDFRKVYIPSAGSVFKGSRFTAEIIRRIHRQLDGKAAFFLSGGITDRLLEFELQQLDKDIRIFAPGGLSWTDNVAYIKSCDLCISPTLVESFGMALLEAMFCGLPVVSFNAGGPADIIRDGENGFLVPMYDMEGLTEKSLEILWGDFAEMGRKAREDAGERFSAEKICQEFTELLSQQV